jgi:hypothetical protein
MQIKRTQRLTMNRSLTAIVIAAASSVAIAACGGSGSPPKTTGPSSSSGGLAGAAYRFVACMRDHGYPNMPEPVVSKGGNDVAIHAVVHGGGPNHPKPIPKACRGILPNPQPESAQQIAAQQAAQRSGLLSFAACMRAHGVPSFPDPTSQGQLTLTMVNSAGVDLHAPNTLDAIKACERASHGIVTPSKVAQALQQAS